MVSGTRNNPYVSSCPARSSETTTKIDLSKLSAESRELYSCITAYFESLVKEKDQRISKLEKEVLELRERVQILDNELDDNAAYIRRETLVMSGGVPPAAAGENCKATVIELLKQQVKLNIDPADISVAHRVGTKVKQGPDRRNIIFKLCRRELKYDILSACRQQRPNYYVNESLTPTRNKVLYVLRQAKKKWPQKIRNLRTSDGSISVYFLPPAASSQERLPFSQMRRITINTRRQLEDFISVELKSSMEELSVKWN